MKQVKRYLNNGTQKQARQRISILSILCLLMSSCASIHFSHDTIPYHPPEPSHANIDIALVLGGGGARGVAHVGVLEVLLKAGIRPDLIVGCSAGALVGALYADSLDIDLVKTTILGTKLNHMLDFSFSFLLFSLSNGEKLKDYLSQKIKARNFEELRLPFIAVATNLQFGTDTIFGTGPLIPALRASSAFPGVFFPIKIQKQYFIDGGLANPVPVSVARKYKPKIVIAADIGEELSEQSPGHMLALIKRSLDISYMQLSDITARKADILIQFPFRDIGTFNDLMHKYLYQEGKRATKLKLDEIQALIKERIPHYKLSTSH